MKSHNLKTNRSVHVLSTLFNSAQERPKQTHCMARSVHIIAQPTEYQEDIFFYKGTCCCISHINGLVDDSMRENFRVEFGVYLNNGICLVGTGGTSSHLGVHVLDIFSLYQCTLVGTKTSLGEFVNALVCGRSSGLDHIQNSAFVRAQSDNLTSNFSAQKSSLARGLQRIFEE